MKKIIFLFSFVLMAGMVSAQAKSCAKAGKKCCAKKSAAKTTMTEAGNVTQVASAVAESEADLAAAADESIERRVCEKSGSVGYYQKAVCEKSGKVSWDQVEFCSKSKAFKGVAMVEPADATEKIMEAAPEGNNK